MATPTVPMTVQDIMDEIYVAVDNDPTNSTNQDDEWTARLRLVNMAIKAWEREDVLWNELWSPSTPGAVTSATSYPLDVNDFRFAGSYMKFTLNGADTYLEIIKPEEAFKYTANNIGSKAVYITGNPSTGYSVNLTWTPSNGDGFFSATMSFNYYKSAKRMTATTTDKPEMSDPSYIVNFVAYRKNLYNGRSNVAQDYLTQTQDCMDSMKIRNAMRVHYGSSELEDVDLVRNNASLGL